MGEVGYIVRRLLGLVPLLLAITFVVFVVLENTPGDPVELRLGQNATPEAIEATRAELGLDDPLVVQYVRFVGDFVTGDLGESIRNGRPVFDEVAGAGRISMVLAGAAMTIATVVGVGVGIASAVRPNSLLDNVLRVAVLAAVSMPVFWLGLVLISNFSVKWQSLPSFGWGTPKQAILPAVTLATFPLAVIARMTRSAMLEVLSADYIRTVRANGLPERAIVLKYALKHALAPVITIVGLQTGALVAGAILTETVFAIPGIGRMTVDAISGRDYPIVRAAVIFSTVVFVLVNLVVDLLYRWIDPRQRQA